MILIRIASSVEGESLVVLFSTCKVEEDYSILGERSNFPQKLNLIGALLIGSLRVRNKHGDSN